MFIYVFNKRHTSECDNFYYGDKVIEKAEWYKYLGVVYSTKYCKKRFLISLPKLVKHKQSRPVVGKL